MSTPRATVKLHPRTSSSRGKKSATPPLQLTEEQAEAIYQSEMEIVLKLSYNQVQPASREFAKHWSCMDSNIINLDTSQTYLNL